MIRLYNYVSNDTVTSNDSLFYLDTVNKVVEDTEFGKCARELIEKVEGVQFCDGSFDKIKSKFTDEPINLTQISTGCKTLINILANPDKSVNILECGDNILREVYKLDSCKLYSNRCRVIDDEDFADKQYICCSKDSEIKVTGQTGIERWYLNAKRSRE